MYTQQTCSLREVPLRGGVANITQVTTPNIPNITAKFSLKKINFVTLSFKKYSLPPHTSKWYFAKPQVFSSVPQSTVWGCWT